MDASPMPLRSPAPDAPVAPPAAVFPWRSSLLPLVVGVTLTVTEVVAVPPCSSVTV